MTRWLRNRNAATGFGALVLSALASPAFAQGSATGINTSDTAWARAVVARTDPNEQESVELLPHLDDLPHLTGGQ